MGATKTEEFTVKDNKIAKYAKALAHPARVAILQLLLKNKTAFAGTLWKSFRFPRVQYHNI